MKKIGLIGGLSWESTLPYYKIINETIAEKKGGYYSVDCILHSINFHEIESTILKGNWDISNRLLSNAAKQLEDAGVDMIAICSNTMHKCIPEIKKCVDVPIFHIVDATSKRMHSKGIAKALLLGTRFTMEESFNIENYLENNIEIIIPEIEDRQIVHDIIFKELCRGIIKESSRDIYLKIINKYCTYDMGVILGCTEIGLLVKQKDTNIPVFDTTEIHAEEIAKKSIEE